MKNRSLKVVGQSGYNYQTTPTIVLKGKWLREAGFDIGRCVQVKCEDGKLIIVLDEIREKVIEAENRFLEAEKSKMYKKVQKETELYRAQMVAEQKVGYQL